MSVTRKILNHNRYIFTSLVLSLIGFISSCYAHSRPTILEQLLDEEIEPWEAITLICAVLLVLISPKRYRTKLAGIVAAVIVIYFTIIVVNIAADL